jgi:hypothetical protein
MHQLIKIALSTALLTTSLFANANPVCDVGREKAKSDLKKSLLEDYDSNYAFIERHLASGMSDFDRICRIKDDEIDNKILKSLNDDYYPNFSFIYRHYQSNKAAYNNLMKN